MHLLSNLICCGCAVLNSGEIWLSFFGGWHSFYRIHFVVMGFLKFDMKPVKSGCVILFTISGCQFIVFVMFAVMYNLPY